MLSAPTVDFRHSPGLDRCFALCRAWFRFGLGGVAACAGAVAVVPEARAVGHRTARFGKSGQHPMHREGGGADGAPPGGRDTARWLWLPHHDGVPAFAGMTGRGGAVPSARGLRVHPRFALARVPLPGARGISE